MSHQHAFKPPVRPEKCICDPLSWIDPNNVPPVCAEFITPDRLCLICDHDFECHGAQS